jgi:hypothetical protein
MTEVNGEGNHHKTPCEWRPGVNAEWTAANKASFADPLKVDCDGTYTTKWPDDLESISYRALVKEGTASPTRAQIKDMIHQVIALNDHDEGTHHGYKSLDCNPAFVGKNWHLLVPGATPDCEAPAPPAPPAPAERPVTPPAEKPPCHTCEWDDSLEPPPTGEQNPRRTDRQPPQRHEEPLGDGEVTIINEKGGVINFNDDCDCEPTTFSRNQRVPQRREQYREQYAEPVPDERCPEGGCGPDPRWLPRQNPQGPNGYYTGRGQIAYNDSTPGDFE